MARRLATGEIYSALNEMRQGFEQVFSAMDRLNASGLRDRDLFDGCRLLAEQAAAWACHQVVESMRERELTNWTLSARAWDRWQNRNERPDHPVSTRRSGQGQTKSNQSGRARKATRNKNSKRSNAR